MKRRMLILFSLVVLVVHLNAQTYDIVVAKDGSGNYTTVQAAFNAVPSNSSSRTVIFIKNGTYKEALNLASDKKNVTIIGQSATGVKLTFDNAATKTNPATGQPFGTSGSSSTYIRASGFYALNIVFENSAGTSFGQALAIYISGDKAIFVNCRFQGRQDTVYGDRCRQYFKNCYIEGTTDFIFGPSTAFFDGCQLYSYGGTALTAASTESYVTYGYVFSGCTISGASGVSTTLGRPWRPYAAVSYLNCNLSSIIKPAGWDNWGNAANEATARYSEYNNMGAGATISSRPAWIKRLTASEAASYTVTNVLKTTYANPPAVDNWNPNTVINDTGGSTSAAELIKHGAGASSQAILVGQAIQGFFYNWVNATSVTVSGLPAGISAVISTSAKSVTFSGVPTQGGTFTYTITTTGGSPNVSKSGTFSVSSAARTSGILDNMEEVSVLSISPMPTKGLLHVILPKDFNESSLGIYNISGQVIYNESVHNCANTIDITTAPSGLYVLRVYNGKKALVHKIIKE